MDIKITQLLIIAAALLTLIIVLNTTTNLAIIVPVNTLLTELVHSTLSGQVRVTPPRRTTTPRKTKEHGEDTK